MLLTQQQINTIHMQAQELLDNLAKDLAELAVPKKAHIQIERILQAYMNQVAKEEAEVVEEVES